MTVISSGRFYRVSASDCSHNKTIIDCARFQVLTVAIGDGQLSGI